MPPQKAPQQTAPDPRAELERLRKLKRLRELQAKAAGQPLPSGPKPNIAPMGGVGEFDPKAFAGINVVRSKPLPAPNAPNPIVTAQRASQQQVMTDWAGQQRDARQAAAAAEAKRKVDQREADAAFGGMDGLPMRVLDDGTVGPTPQRDLGVRGTVNVLNTPSETGNFLLELGDAGTKMLHDSGLWGQPKTKPAPLPDYDPRATFGNRGLGNAPLPPTSATPQPEEFRIWQGQGRFPKLPLDAPTNDAEMVADVGGKFIGAVLMPGGVYGASEKLAAGIGKGLAPTLAKASPIVQQTAGYGGRLGLLGARGAYDAGRIGGIMGEDGSKVKTAYDWAADPLNWAIEPLGSIIYRASIFLKTGGKQVTPNRVQLEGAMNTLQRADASPDQLRAAVETINRITPPPAAAPEVAPTPPYPRPDLDAAQARPTAAPTPEQAASATPPYPRPDMDPVQPETAQPAAVTPPPAPVEAVGPPKRFSESPEPRGGGFLVRNADRIGGGALGAWTGGAYDAVAAGADGNENRGPDIINPISGGVAGMLVPRFAAQAWRAGRRAAMPPANRSAYDTRIAYNVLRKQLERAGMRTPEEVVAAKEASFGGIDNALLDMTQEGVNTATNLSRLPGSTSGTMRNRAEELLENRPGRVERYIEETTGLSTAAVSGDVKKLADEAMANATPAYKALRDGYPLGSINSQRLEQIEGLAPHIQAVDEYRLLIAANEGRVVGDFEYWDLVKRDIDAKEQQLIDKFGATMDDIRIQKLESTRSALVKELDNLVKGYKEARDLGGEAPKIREAFAEGQTYFGGRYSGDEVLEKISKWNGVPLTAAQSGVIRIILGKAKSGGAAVSALSSARAKEQLAAVFGKAKTDDLQAFLAADAAIVQNASRTNPNVGSATGQVMLGAGEGMIPAAAEAIRAARNPVEAVLGRMSQSGAYSQAQRDIMGEMLAKGVTAENLAPIFAGRRPRGGGRPRGGAGPTTPQGPPTAGGAGPAAGAAAGPPPRAAAAATQQPRPAPSQEAVLAAMAQVTKPGPGRARSPMGPPARETIWDGPIPTKPQSLLAWIRSQRGIDDTNYMTGDVAAIMGRPNGMPGLINRKDGTGLDELTRKAYQEGFDVNPEDAGTLMRLIEEEFGGNPSYRIGAAEEWQTYQDTLRARRGEEPDQNSLGAFPGAGNAAAAASSVGGAAYGYYNPQDANEDGVIDDYDRQMTAMGMGFGGLVSAGLVRGAMGSRPKGPPGVQSNSFGGGKAESRPKGPPKQPDAMAKFKAEMIAAYPKAKGWNANKWRAKLREYRDMFVAGSDDGSFSAADLGREAPIAAAAKLAWDRAQRADRLPDSGVEIAARIPTSKRPFEDAGTYRLTPDMEAMRENPETFRHNMRLVRKYPGMPEVPGGKAADVAEAAVRHTTDNLKYIWRMIPEKVRERTRIWYVGANSRATRMAKDADKPVESMAAVIASLSPQKDWNQNVSLGERVVSALKTKGNHPWTPEMEARARKIYGNEAYAEDLEAIRGKTLGQLTDPYEKAMWIRVNDEAHSDRSYYIISPEGENVGERGGIAAWGSNSEIAKAVKVFENPSRANISEVIGKRNKVRSFYNNIVNPKSAVDITSDTHAVAAMWMRPLSGNSPEVAHNFGNSLAKAKQPKGWKAARSVAGNGSVGTYGLAHEAYTRAARELSEEFGQTILPREVQSVVWEAVRNLFPAKWKTAANKAAIDEIWQRFSKGEITLEGARDAIVQKAGGFDAAKWDTPRSHSELDAEARDAADAGELLDEGVPGRRAKAVDGGTGRRSARGTAGLPSVRSAGSGGDGGGRYSSGGLAPLEGAPNVRGATGPDVGIVSVAESFAEKSGIPFRRQARYAEVDEALARRIAQAYEDMPHAPQDPAVRAAYENLSRQTRAQYDALVDAGYRFDFFDAATDPYKGNPSDAMRDLRANKRMSVYGTYDGFGTAGVTGADIANNPMLADTGVRWTDQNGVERPVVVNDLFRAVHDAFGHGLEGAGFRARGEENAWQAHMRLYTGDARAAATNETRGQNSWVNYGPLGDANRTASLEDTKFARQKTGLLPEWAWTENLVEDALPVQRSSAAKSPANALKSGRAPVKGPPTRKLPGQTSQSSPVIGSALASGGLTAGATYAATGDEDLALRAGLGAGIVGGVVGSRLSKGSTPKGPPPASGAPRPPPVRMGFGSRDLPMDEASRMGRAREQGFDVDTPLYHGTSSDFDEFRISEDGHFGPGVYLTRNPQVASQYAAKASGPNGANVRPVYVRGKIATGDKYDDVFVDVAEKFPDETNDQLNVRAVAILKKRGYAGIEGDGQLSIFDPSNIRGKFAKFDPSETQSSKLLAGVSGNPEAIGAAGGTAIGMATAPDQNGDGVVDAQERMLGGAGGAVSGGIAGRLLRGGSGAAPRANPPVAQGFGGRPKPPPAKGPPKPRVSPPKGPGTLSRMVAGGAIGGIAGGVAGEADPQTAETAQRIADTKALLDGLLGDISTLEADKAFFRDAEITEIQKRLKREGKNIGNTGPNRDGVDGINKGLTQKGIEEFKAQIEADLNAAYARRTTLETRAEKLKQDASFEATRPTDEQQQFRDFAPLVGGVVGAALGKSIRLGGSIYSKAAAKPVIARLDALLNATPIAKPKTPAQRAAVMSEIDRRASDLNEFWREGGANTPRSLSERVGMKPTRGVPFASKGNGDWAARAPRNVMSPSELFPDRFIGRNVGPVDALVGGAGATEAYLADQNAQRVKGDLNKAYIAAKDDPSEKNLARVQELEDQYALSKGWAMLGTGLAVGTGIGVFTSKYARKRGDVSTAEQELAILRRAIADLKKQTNKAAGPPKPPVTPPVVTPPPVAASTVIPPLPPARPRRTQRPPIP